MTEIGIDKNIPLNTKIICSFFSAQKTLGTKKKKILSKTNNIGKLLLIIV